MENRLVRLDTSLMLKLHEYKRLTGVPIQSWVNRALEQYLKNDGPPILEGWGVSPKEIDRISHMRYAKEPEKEKAPDRKKALA